MKKKDDEEEFDDDSDADHVFGKIIEEALKEFKALKNSSSRRKKIKTNLQQTSLFGDLD